MDEFSGVNGKELLKIYSTENGISIYINEPEQIITIEQMAVLLGIQIGMVYKLCEDNEIPHSRPFGARRYFLRSEILDWIKRFGVPCKEASPVNQNLPNQ